MTEIPLALPVNIEGLLSEFLRADDDVVALVGDHVYTSIPNGFSDWPAIRLQRIGGAPRSGPLIFDQPRVQFDCYGGPKAVAWKIGSTLQAVVKQRLGGRYDQGYVYPDGMGQGIKVGGLRWMPDTTFDPAKPRYIFDAEFLTKP